VHSLIAVSAAGTWAWWSWHVCFTIGPLLRHWFLPHEPSLLAFLTFPLVWLVAWMADLTWLVCAIPGGTIMAYVVAMAGCNRVLETLPRPGQDTGEVSWNSQRPPHPILIERVSLSNDEAASHGMPGPVIVERLHYPDPRDHA
jgi:hypothetical protein